MGFLTLHRDSLSQDVLTFASPCPGVKSFRFSLARVDDGIGESALSESETFDAAHARIPVVQLSFLHGGHDATPVACREAVFEHQNGYL
ncbi:hypothetical protein U1Q18_052095, partial [Sarracenia purpurea var. burkii]